MKRNFNVIRIDGFKGIFFAVFAICCLIAGFLSFPGWVCMHIWNYIAGYFTQMPVMNITHGIILWCIIALSAYALNKGNFAVSFGSAKPMPGSEERLKEILRKFNEENDMILKSVKCEVKNNTVTDSIKESQSKIDDTTDSTSGSEQMTEDESSLN